MKLSRTTEVAVLGALIAAIAFAPDIAAVREILSSPLGKALALGGIVAVWKTVSPLISVLLVVLYLKCTRSSVWERFSGAEQTCLCEGEGYIWDPSTKVCTNPEGKEGTVKSCTCMSGYSWDGGPRGTKQCVATSGSQPPLPMTPEVEIPSSAAPTAAPAMSTGPVTSTAPMTTPSAVQDMVVSAGPQQTPPEGGVQPTLGTTTSSSPAPM